MAVPTDRRYAQTHEWCKLEAETAVVGLTQFAADQLTDITFVELPDVGTKVTAGTQCGEVESVKAATELYAPVSGEVVEINDALVDAPDLVNRDPFGAAWMIRIAPADVAQMDDLLDAAAYEVLAG